MLRKLVQEAVPFGHVLTGQDLGEPCVHGVYGAAVVQIEQRVRVHQEINVKQRHRRQAPQPALMVSRETLEVGLDAASLQPALEQRLASRRADGVTELARRHQQHVVVADDHEQATTRPRRVLLQPHQQLDHADAVGPAVHQVAQHRERRVAAAPRP